MHHSYPSLGNPLDLALSQQMYHREADTQPSRHGDGLMSRNPNQCLLMPFLGWETASVSWALAGISWLPKDCSIANSHGGINVERMMGLHVGKCGAHASYKLMETLRKQLSTYNPLWAYFSQLSRKICEWNENDGIRADTYHKCQDIRQGGQTQYTGCYVLM
jgi:hypothetical protein